MLRISEGEEGCHVGLSLLSRWGSCIMLIKYIFGTHDASKKLFDSHFLCEGLLVRVVAKCVVCFPPQYFYLRIVSIVSAFSRFFLFIPKLPDLMFFFTRSHKCQKKWQMTNKGHVRVARCQTPSLGRSSSVSPSNWVSRLPHGPCGFLPQPYRTPPIDFWGINSEMYDSSSMRI